MCKNSGLRIVPDKKLKNSRNWHQLALDQVYYLYGLPKIHKTDIPLRPILSAIGTHSYNLAKFLVSLLRPLSLSSYLISNSFTFIQELVSLNLNSDQLIMASFDVKSLFTNIPLNETIQIILDQRFINSRLYHGFSRKDFE